jgi:hypothetical protein
VITRMGSWRVQARGSVLNEDFSTLGGAAAWCRQHLECTLQDTKLRQAARAAITPTSMTSRFQRVASGGG